MIISRAPKSFRWFYGVSLACGAMCLILAIGGRTIAERLGVKNPAAKGYCLSSNKSACRHQLI